MLLKAQRRSFLAGLSLGGATLLRPFLRREAAAQAGRPGPVRLLVIQTPDGRIPETWKPTGTETDFTLGPTLRPFDSVKSDLVVLDGIDHVTRGGGGEPHCGGFIQWMTGMGSKITRPNYSVAQVPSVDQIFAQKMNVAGDTRWRSLQLAGDMSTLAGDVSHRYMSWAGFDQPLPGEHRSIEIYKRLFDLFAPPSGSAGTAAALDQLVKERRSVLDTLKRDWQRLSAAVPAAQKPNFEAHLAAIRRLEQDLTTLTPAAVSSACRAPDVAQIPPAGTSNATAFPTVYRANLEMIRLAFACDFTRIVTFMSSPTTSSLVHKTWLPEIAVRKIHHAASHDNNNADLNLIMTGYSERIAEFIKSLKATPDGAGFLLDHMLVIFASELGDGRSHRHSNVPFVLFGRAQGRLRTGRYLSFASKPRSSNDVWLAASHLLGAPLDTVGDPTKCAGPLPGLV